MANKAVTHSRKHEAQRKLRERQQEQQAQPIERETSVPVEQEARVVEENTPKVADQFTVAEQEGVPVREVSPTTEDIGLTTEQQGKPVHPSQQKKVKVMPTFDEALAKAKQENPHRFKNVVRVVELTNDGEPKRVVIQCSDPQFKTEGSGESAKQVSVCAGEREIAIQDLFQVYRCQPCADRAVRIARRQAAKKRVKKAKALLRARREGM